MVIESYESKPIEFDGFTITKVLWRKNNEEENIISTCSRSNILAGTFVGGCSSQSPDATVNASEEYTLETLGYAHNSLYVREIRDRDTGVHYFYCGRYSVCPRYNADGSLYID